MQSDVLSYDAVEDTGQRSPDRIIGKFIASLKVCVIRLDEVLNTLDENEQVVKKALTQYRWSIHGQIDALMKLKRKTPDEIPFLGMKALYSYRGHKVAPRNLR